MEQTKLMSNIFNRFFSRLLIMINAYCQITLCKRCALCENEKGFILLEIEFFFNEKNLFFFKQESFASSQARDRA